MSSNECKGIEAWQAAEERFTTARLLVGGGSYVNVRPIQWEELTAFLTTSVVNGKGGFIHLSGLPGTGKTLTARQALGELRKTRTDVHTEYISCVNPSAELSQLVRSITNPTVDAAAGRPTTVVVILDEIDHLFLGNEWSQEIAEVILEDVVKLDKPGFIVVGISNTLDNPFRRTNIVFPAYTAGELTRIIVGKVGEGVFDSGALKAITSHSAAAKGGDARTTIALCGNVIDQALKDLASAKAATPTDTDRALQFKQVSVKTAWRIARAEQTDVYDRYYKLPQGQKVLLGVCIDLKDHHLHHLGGKKFYVEKQLRPAYAKALACLGLSRVHPMTEFIHAVQGLEAAGAIKVEPRYGGVEVKVDRDEFARILNPVQKEFFVMFTRPRPSDEY